MARDSRLDAQLGRAGRPPRENELEERARDEDGREHVGDQAEEQRRREPANRPGAELEQERGRDERRDVRVDDRDEDAVEAGGDACRAPFFVASSSRMRSKIRTFESTPMPIVRMKPAMPGSVMTAPRYAMKPIRITRFSATETNALMPASL